MRREFWTAQFSLKEQKDQLQFVKLKYINRRILKGGRISYIILSSKSLSKIHKIVSLQILWSWL